MKRVFISIACCVALALPFAGNAAEPLFEYPQVPDQLTKVNMRSNFMINRLWDECKLDKEEITNIESFRETFTDFLSFFPLADVDEVDKAVKKFVDKVAKNEANLRTVAGFLDSEVYNPMSQFCSDDVYLIFARHLIDNKKVDDGLKNVLQENAAKINNSRINSVFGDMPVSKGGASAALHSLQSQYTVLIFNVDGDFDTSIYKLRLSTDVVTGRLIKNGAVNVVSIYSNRTKDKSGDDALWYTAMVPDMERVYDLRLQPSVYLLGADKKIIAKSPAIEQVLSLMAQLGNSLGV